AAAAEVGFPAPAAVVFGFLVEISVMERLMNNRIIVVVGVENVWF
ncbi:hypothetical protein A2U01_0061580, partial [Trifolium medium]|nr:hypothetical protein [Trifolium medium]